jgi:hypothetical protein
MYKIYSVTLLITNMFRSLMRSSSGQLYKSTKNTRNCQIVQMETTWRYNKCLNLSMWTQNVSLYIIKKTDKI